jgi:hypothetical protein
MLSNSNHTQNLTTSNQTKTTESAKTNWLDWMSYLPEAISHTFLFKTGEGWSGSRGGLGGAIGGEQLKLGLGSEGESEEEKEIRARRPRVAPEHVVRLTLPPQQLLACARPAWHLGRATCSGLT